MIGQEEGFLKITAPNFDTDYSKWVNNLLAKSIDNGFKVIDLYAGCGGLALGFEAAGFKTIGYEKDADCCLSYQYNLDAACFRTLLNKTSSFESGDVVIGGPPCQPFSVGGYQKGEKDNRDGFPVFIKAVKDIKPKVWLFENVRGLLYKNKLYLQNIIDQLAALGYKIELKLINTSHYKVPQNRERLIVVGHQSRFFFPETQKNKITAYEALGKYYDYAPDNGKYLTASMDKYVKKYETASKCITPRDLHKDMPARTVTCRNIAGATGDMLRLKLPDGRRRRLLVQEAARLQSFPDWFKFQGTELSIYNQIGNAVPPVFAYFLAKSVLDCLKNSLNTNYSCRQENIYQPTLI